MFSGEAITVTCCMVGKAFVLTTSLGLRLVPMPKLLVSCSAIPLVLVCPYRVSMFVLTVSGSACLSVKVLVSNSPTGMSIVAITFLIMSRRSARP